MLEKEKYRTPYDLMHKTFKHSQSNQLYKVKEIKPDTNSFDNYIIHCINIKTEFPAGYTFVEFLEKHIEIE